jgi:pyruvate dehydrogenase E2 component (dihydrolipoamide acetyltransferase)
MSNVEFKLPDVGEGLTEATIIQWLVTEGQVVEVDTPLVEIETEKVTVELPSPFAGTILALHGGVDDVIAVGATLVSIETDSDPLPQTTGGVVNESDTPPLLVGYGAPISTRPEPRTSVRATPPTRKLARDLGIDLHGVTPTGKYDEITREDVMRLQNGSVSSEESITLTGLRKHMARAMVRSATEAPQATLMKTVDATKLLDLHSELKERREFQDLRITPFALIAYCFVRALTSLPLGNASFDNENNRIVVHDSINLGIAIATDQGLVVPNIKSAGSISFSEFMKSLRDVVDAARQGQLLPAQISGGTVTMTNIGALGLDTGTPLLNPGEAAILAVGSIDRRPWVVSHPEEKLEIRSVLQLALTIDHRILDGSEGAQLLTATASMVSNPDLNVVKA